MNARRLLMVANLAVLSLGAVDVGAGEKPGIERADAEKIALARVPGGTIKEGELETEHGKLVWSFDITRPSSAEVIEVQVDASTGEVVAVETETPDDQAKEAAEDKQNHK